MKKLIFRISKPLCSENTTFETCLSKEREARLKFENFKDLAGNFQENHKVFEALPCISCGLRLRLRRSLDHVPHYIHLLFMSILTCDILLQKLPNQFQILIKISFHTPKNTKNDASAPKYAYLAPPGTS